MFIVDHRDEADARCFALGPHEHTHAAREGHADRHSDAATWQVATGLSMRKRALCSCRDVRMAGVVANPPCGPGGSPRLTGLVRSSLAGRCSPAANSAPHESAC